MTYHGIVRNGVVVLEGDRPADGTVVDVTPREPADRRDISARIRELLEIEDGWLDGKGRAPSRQGMSWLASAFERDYPADLAAPYLYPTAEGGVQAEWSLPPWEISLEIDLATRIGQWHALDLDSGDESTRALHLDSDEAWDWLRSEIAKRSRGAA